MFKPCSRLPRRLQGLWRARSSTCNLLSVAEDSRIFYNSHHIRNAFHIIEQLSTRSANQENNSHLRFVCQVPDLTMFHGRKNPRESTANDCDSHGPSSPSSDTCPARCTNVSNKAGFYFITTAAPLSKSASCDLRDRVPGYWFAVCNRSNRHWKRINQPVVLFLTRGAMDAMSRFRLLP